MADLQRKTANLFDDHNVINIPDVGDRYGSILPNGTYSIYNGTDNTMFYGESNWLGRHVACSPHSTATITLNSNLGTVGGVFMALNSASQGGCTVIEGSTPPSSYIPYWQHSLRKLTTATKAVENPLYSDGTAITSYTIKGNTVQNGIPTPSNPVDVNGVGVRTENLFDSSFTVGYYLNATTGLPQPTNDPRMATLTPIDVTDYNSVTFSFTRETSYQLQVMYSILDGNTLVSRVAGQSVPLTIDISNATKLYLCVYPPNSSKQVSTDSISSVMLNTGSTAKPFEPYGYKIPISSGGVTTNIYLGSTASIRNVKKAMFSGGDSEGWYLQSINSYGIANFALNSAISPLKWIDTQRLLWVCNRFLPQSSLIADTNTEGIMLNQYNACFVRINSSTVSTTAAFKTWLRNNPIVVYYVLANAETAAVNEPLMKIGNYADALSNAMSIPTTEGANSITVDTTVQPSEFTATWTGWHDASVKKRDGSDWQ